jgi:hypothetical protein
MMNEKGALPALFLLQLFAPILFIIVGLIVASIMFAFFKSLFIASVLGVVGGVLIWKGVNSLDAKSSQVAVIMGFLLVLGALVFGIMTPLSITSGFYTTQHNSVVFMVQDYLGALVGVIV